MKASMSLLIKTLRQNTGLTEGEINNVFNAYEPMSTRHNQVLLNKGEVAKNLYFVEQGFLRVFVTDPSGNEFTRFIIEAGTQGTAFPSFVRQSPSTASIQCVGHAEVVHIAYPRLRQLHQEMPEFEQLYLKTIELAYIASIQRIETLISMRAQERYEQLAREKPTWIKQLPANVIAEYLGITKETLSRIKSAR